LGALGAAWLVFAALGCAGDLDPALFPGAGSAGSSGGGGTNGAGGSSQACDAPTVVFAMKCNQPGCHASSAPSSGLDLQSAGVVARLLNKTPDPSMSLACAASTEPYLQPQSNPATGLLLDKLNAPPPCGILMPEIGMLTPSDVTCLNAWATAVTTGAITQ
jgi:hypothetical protein